MNWEKELLGLYVSGHPLDDFKDKFANNEHSIKSVKTLPDDKMVVIGGIIDEVKEIQTKKGDKMAFVRMSDFTDSIETVFFTKIYNSSRLAVQVGKCVAIKGKISNRNGETSLLVEAIKML